MSDMGVGNVKKTSDDARLRAYSILMRFIPAIAAALITFIAYRTASNEITLQRSSGAIPMFYQRYFEPAVRIACGQSFEVDSTGKSVSDAVPSFLNVQQPELECSEVTAIANENRSTPPAQIWYYWLLAVGRIWQFTGIRWDVLDDFAAATYALSALILFAILKIWMRTPVAFTLTYIAVSAALPYLLFQRDLNKAPFVLASVLFSVWIASRSVKLPALIGTSSAIGVTIGIGYGFRPDALIGIPLVLLSLLVFRQAPSWRVRILQGTAAAGVFMVSFLLVATPILRAAESGLGNCQFHFAYLGLSDTNTNSLGISSGSRSYLSHFDDQVLARAVYSFGDRVMDQQDIGFCTPEYDSVVQQMYIETVLAFPRDFVDRAGASARQVLVYGAVDETAVGSVGIAYPYLLDGYAWNPETRPLIELAILISWAILILSAFHRSTRLGAFLLFGALYLTSYPIIQFHERHFFHLAFLALVPLGIGASSLLTLVGNRLLPNGWRVPNSAQGGVASRVGSQIYLSGAVVVSFLALLAITVFYSTAIENKSVRRLNDQYTSAKVVSSWLLHLKQGVTTSVELPPDLGIDLISDTKIVGGDSTSVDPHEGRVLRLTLERRSCTSDRVEIDWKLAGPIPDYFYEGTMKLTDAEPSRTLTAFLPVYFESGKLTELSLVLNRFPEVEAEDFRFRGCEIEVSWLDSADLPNVWVGFIADSKPLQ